MKNIILLKQNFFKDSKIQIILIFVFFTLIILVFTQSGIFSTNPASRFITIEALVEKGSFIINEKHFVTDDKIIRDNNFYSTKPPVLTFIGAGIYYILHAAFNINLPETNFIKPNLGVYLITLVLIGGTYLLLLYFFYKTLVLLKVDKKYRALLLLGLGIGTLYLTYSRTLNNHTIAGSILFIGFYYLLLIKIKEEKKPKYFFLAGFLATLAAVIDLPTGLCFLGLFLIYLLITYPFKFSLFFILTAIPLLLLHFFLNYQITGDLLPAQLHPEYAASLSIEGQNVYKQLSGMDVSQDSNKALYLFNILFGTHGFFLYSPILVFPWIAIAKILRDKNNEFKPEAIMVISGFFIVILFYTFKVGIFAGLAYGFRWLIAITPLIYFFTIFLFKERLSKNFINFFTVILITSSLIAIIGFYDPWLFKYTNLIMPATNTSTFDFPLLVNIKAIIYQLSGLIFP